MVAAMKPPESIEATNDNQAAVETSFPVVAIARSWMLMPGMASAKSSMHLLTVSSSAWVKTEPTISFVALAMR